MMRRSLLAFVLLMLAWVDASAHTRSQSFSSWSVQGNELDGVYQVDAYRVTQLSERPEDLAKLLTAHLDGRIRVEQAGVACKRTSFRPLSAPRGDMRVEVRFTCSKPIAEADASLFIGGFFDVSISHIHYARLGYPDGRMDEVVLTQGQQSVIAGASGASPQSSFFSLLVLGFEHVLSGVDHIAFLVALMMLAGGLRQTILSVTGFTVGHSITLALVAIGILRPDMAAIEALIGFTVAWAAGDALARVRGLPPVLGLAGAVAILLFGLAGQALGLVQLPILVLVGIALFAGCMSFSRGLDSGRVAPAVAVLFGLAHGAGFAGPLLDLKIEADSLFWTLLAFNLGVEAGQLVAVGIVTLVLVALRRSQLKLPELGYDVLASLLFALGTFWFVSRSLA
jgi:hypothetical protein